MVRALGGQRKKRHASLPDVPAIPGVGPGYEVLAWDGIVAPAATPQPIIERLDS